MLAEERAAKILESINELGAVRVESLARELGVSEMTVRRDLKKCENSGALQRCHGGAVVKTATLHEAGYEEKHAVNHAAKLGIARCCAGLVTPGSAVYLDAGTTTYEIAQLLAGMQGLTIITNDLFIAVSLLKSDVQLIVPGGEVQKSTGSMLGHIAEQGLENLRVDFAFFGAMCIDENFSIFTPTIEKAFLKRMVARNANKSYLAVDASKFGRRAIILQSGLQDYTGVVTDRVFTPSEQKQLREKGVHIIPTVEAAP